MRKLLISALLAVPLLGFTQVTQSRKGYTFRAALKTGQVISYRLSGQQVNSKSSGLKISGPFSFRVLSVQNGIASVRATQGPILLNGQVFRPVSTSEGQLDRRLRPIDSEASAGPFSGIYPERGIKLGESWTAPLQLTGAVTGNMAATYKLSRFAIVDGERVAVLDTTITGQLSGSGTTLIRVSDGTPQSLSLTISLIYNSGGPGRDSNIKLRFDIRRK